MSSPLPGSDYRVMIVDDEPLAREGMQAAVVRVSADGAHTLKGVRVVSVCENGIVALERIRELQPDILLLDIAMPVLDGFAMLERLEPEATPPVVIFVTAYDEHAVRAFDAEALDFLVKPVLDERFEAALARAVKRVDEARALRALLDSEDAPAAPAAPAAGASPAGRIEQLVIPERGRQVIVPVSEVEWIEGDTYYVRVHAQGKARLLRERLSRLEASLDPERFHRTHRSALVRVDLIRELRAESPYSYTAVLSTGARVPVSRERHKALAARLRRGGL